MTVTTPPSFSIRPAGPRRAVVAVVAAALLVAVGAWIAQIIGYAILAVATGRECLGV